MWYQGTSTLRWREAEVQRPDIRDSVLHHGTRDQCRSDVQGRRKVEYSLKAAHSAYASSASARGGGLSRESATRERSRCRSTSLRTKCARFLWVEEKALGSTTRRRYWIS